MKVLLGYISILSLQVLAQDFGELPVLLNPTKYVKALEESQMMQDKVLEVENLEKSNCTTSVKVRWPYSGDRLYYIADCESAQSRFRIKYKVKADRNGNFSLTGYKRINYVTN